MTYTHRVRIQPAMTIDEGIRRPRFWAEVFDLTMRAVEVVGRLANVWSQEQTVQVAV